MKNIFLLFLMLGSQFGFAGEIVEQKFVVGPYEYQVEAMDNFLYPFKNVHSDKLLLITHNSQYWDNNRITWAGTEKLVEHFALSKQPFYYLADLQDRALKDSNDFFAAGISANDIYPFQGDSHRIVLHGSTLVIAGGNFTICACQTTRSALALSQTNLTLNVYFASDAIYEGISGGQVTLEQLTQEKSDMDFMNYLGSDYFNNDTLPCTDSLFHVKNRSFKYQIFRDGKFIGQIGSGKTSVNLYFQTSESVIKALKN